MENFQREALFKKVWREFSKIQVFLEICYQKRKRFSKGNCLRKKYEFIFYTPKKPEFYHSNRFSFFCLFYEIYYFSQRVSRGTQLLVFLQNQYFFQSNFALNGFSESGKRVNLNINEKVYIIFPKHFFFE